VDYNFNGGHPLFTVIGNLLNAIYRSRASVMPLPQTRDLFAIDIYLVIFRAG